MIVYVVYRRIRLLVFCSGTCLTGWILPGGDSIYLSIFLYVYPSILSIYLSIYLWIHQSAYISIYLSIYIYAYIDLFIYISTMSIKLSNFHLSSYLPINPSIYNLHFTVVSSYIITMSVTEIMLLCSIFYYRILSGAAVVLLNFRAGSTFPVPVCTVPGQY